MASQLTGCWAPYRGVSVLHEGRGQRARACSLFRQCCLLNQPYVFCFLALPRKCNSPHLIFISPPSLAYPLLYRVRGRVYCDLLALDYTRCRLCRWLCEVSADFLRYEWLLVLESGPWVTVMECSGQGRCLCSIRTSRNERHANVRLLNERGLVRVFSQFRQS